MLEELRKGTENLYFTIFRDEKLQVFLLPLGIGSIATVPRIVPGVP
ncbi:MAG: hypothetical protein QXN22_07855 [Thermofilaceae archaeon]